MPALLQGLRWIKIAAPFVVAFRIKQAQGSAPKEEE